LGIQITTTGVDLIIGVTTTTRGILGELHTMDGAPIIMAGEIFIITDGILGEILIITDGAQATVILMDLVDTMAIMMEELDCLTRISFTEEEVL
jgi:hypothetical protein